MHFAAFKSDAPLGDLSRALDELARAGFALCGVNVTAGAPADIRIDYRAEGAISAETYLARLGRMPGVSGLSGGPACGG